MKTTTEVEKECYLYERVLGISATTKTFYPFDVAIDQPIHILHKYLNEIGELNTHLPKRSDHMRIVHLASKAISALNDPIVSASHKLDLLFLLYFTCCKACFTLQDEFGLMSVYWTKFNSRYQAVLRGWTLGGCGISNTYTRAFEKRITSHFSYSHSNEHD